MENISPEVSLEIANFIADRVPDVILIAIGTVNSQGNEANLDIVTKFPDQSMAHDFLTQMLAKEAGPQLVLGEEPPRPMTHVPNGEEVADVIPLQRKSEDD